MTLVSVSVTVRVAMPDATVAAFSQEYSDDVGNCPRDDQVRQRALGNPRKDGEQVHRLSGRIDDFHLVGSSVRAGLSYSGNWAEP